MNAPPVLTLRVRRERGDDIPCCRLRFYGRKQLTLLIGIKPASQGLKLRRYPVDASATRVREREDASVISHPNKVNEELWGILEDEISGRRSVAHEFRLGRSRSEANKTLKSLRRAYFTDCLDSELVGFSLPAVVVITCKPAIGKIDVPRKEPCVAGHDVIRGEQCAQPFKLVKRKLIETPCPVWKPSIARNEISNPVPDSRTVLGGEQIRINAAQPIENVRALHRPQVWDTLEERKPTFGVVSCETKEPQHGIGNRRLVLGSSNRLVAGRRPVAPTRA